jgi:hypothetical protein
VVPDDEDGRLVSRILHDVFLLGNPDKEAGPLTVRDLLFDMVGRQHALKVTNGVIAEGVNAVAENQGVGLGFWALGESSMKVLCPSLQPVSLPLIRDCRQRLQ